MPNDFDYYPRWVLVNGRRGFDMTHAVDFDLAGAGNDPATGQYGPCVVIYMSICQEVPAPTPQPIGTPGVMTVRALQFFGDDAAALRGWLPGYCAKVNK